MAKGGRVAGRLAVVQFQRAIADGTFTWISEKLKNAIMGAYVAINEASLHIEGMLSGAVARHWEKTAAELINRPKTPIQSAIDALLAEAES